MNPSPSAFYNTPRSGDNLSSDWDKYSTAEESLKRIGKQFKLGTTIFKNPEDFRIYNLPTQKVREITPAQIVKHYPKENTPEKIGDPNNRPHALIIGTKGDKNDPEVRLKLVSIGFWA